MKFDTPLLEGWLVQRYKRFFADVTLTTGEQVTAHCANSGSMLSVKEPGSRVWLSPATNPERKLRYTWELIEIGGAMVGINTGHPNRVVAEAIAAGEIKELKGYASLKREQKYGKNSRIDVLLESPGKRSCYVEVKNVTMKRDLNPSAAAEFPDAVTERGAKHLRELSDVVAGGGRSVMFYLVQRTDARRFTVANDIDPEYGKALKLAVKAGVEIVCYGCNVGPDGISIARPLTLDLPF
ncbi:MAG: DNA/RNA nuclease SfsA [Alphaproteobacteria bacterium]|nr:DNA/RNA nuclease SfsA [Alphaproteobacteria bacterium]